MSDVRLAQPGDQTDPNSSVTNQKLERLFRSCYIRLGGSSIRVELEDEDYETAWDVAVRHYRMLSSRSVYRTYGFLVLKHMQQEYVLPEEIDNVMDIQRVRGFFAAGAAFDPFNAATANMILRNARPASGFMGVATYDFFLQFEKTLGRVFAREIPFLFRPENHTLYIAQMPKYGSSPSGAGGERVLLDCQVVKSFDELLSDHFSRKYLEDMCLAQLKMILGRSYSKFTSLPGSQGGMALGGDKLLQEGIDEWLKLEQGILDYSDGGEVPFAHLG